MDAVSMGAMTLGDLQENSLLPSADFPSVWQRNAAYRSCVSQGESVPADKQTSWENIAYCVRSACELGMDIVKTTYTGDPDSMAGGVVCSSSFGL